MEIMNFNQSNIVLVLSFLLLLSCSEINKNKTDINTSHLDYLYEEIYIDGTEMAIIHIYSNSPSYKYVDDDDEGSACVDDAARAAIFYLKHFNQTGNLESIRKSEKLLKFLLYLQAENGYFYNFIWSDHSINQDFKTSIAEPNWWSWRALWVLTESYSYYKKNDKAFADQIERSVEKLITAIKKQIPTVTETITIDGIDLPLWLPAKYASDQASVLLLGLSNYLKFKDDIVIKEYIGLLRTGIIKMQINDKTSPIYGAFLSWESLWHAWGNNQAYALLKSYQVLEDKVVLNSALKELDNFYELLLKRGFVSSFNVTSNGNDIVINNEKIYPQIAYNIRPMIYALLEAYKITNDVKYSKLAGSIGKWFWGSNPANTIMYDHSSGLVYDGINSAEIVNMNSGAESTIEALLSILAISKNEIASKSLIK